jgi:hypothetical protein
MHPNRTIDYGPLVAELGYQALEAAIGWFQNHGITFHLPYRADGPTMSS